MRKSRRKLTIVCGNAGTGKTTLALRLAKESGAALFDIDTASERLVQAGLRKSGDNPDDRDSEDYKATYREPIHETLFALADQNLDHLDCIVVAPFTQERRTKDFPERISSRLNCEVEIVLVWCNNDARRKRIIARGNPRDAGKLEAWGDYARAGLDPEPRPPFAHRFVDTSESA